MRELEHPRLADTVAGQVGQQLRLGVACQRDDRRALVTDLDGAFEEPWRCPRERVVCCELDQCPPDVLVGVVDVDVARTSFVRRSRDRARDGRVLDSRDHLHELSRLHVRADPDCQLGVPGDAGLVRQSGSCHVSSRRIGIDFPSFVTPSTSSSGPPIMKSVCTDETFMPSPGSPSNTSGIPKP